MARLRCMTKQHLKSPCCRAKNIHYGGKRRQCKICQRTWTIRPKRRGRKKIRYDPRLIVAYFSSRMTTIRRLAEKRSCGRDRIQRLLNRSLIHYIQKYNRCWLTKLKSKGKLIAVADAAWHRLKGRRVTTYLILLRSTSGNTAVMCPPVIIPRHEDQLGWEQAFASIPRQIQARICVLVCDGHNGLIHLGKRRGWLIQRCHFHLLANLEMYLGSRKNPLINKLLSNVRGLLTTVDGAEIHQSVVHLKRLLISFHSRGVRRVISGLLTNYHDYQTYLRHPRFNLPNTTNAAESYINGVRNLIERCRGFRNLQSMNCWLTGYVIWKSTIRCNGKNQQN